MSDRPTVLPWQVHSEESVLKTRVFEVKTHEASSQIHPESRGAFSVLNCPDWVNVIAITPEQHVVLIRQFRHGSGEITIEIPGGMVDEGEGYLDAGVRELVEETGYVGGEPRLIGEVSPNPAIQNNRCGTLLIEACQLSSTTALDEHEEIEVFTAPLSEVLEMIRSGVINHALVLAAFQHLALQN